MTNPTRDTSHSVVRWTFQRDEQFLTCRVDRDADGSLFIAAVVPHDHPQLAAVVTFKTGMSAMHYHAGTAARLRQLGWKLVGYTNGQSPRQAAA